MTDYVTTRWYRAPEIIFSQTNYSSSIDVWSVGCILAEMYLQKPLFPGKNEDDQIKMILELVGTPKGSFLENNNILSEFE